MEVSYSAAYTWRGRRSDWGQLIFPTRGTLTVHSDDGQWVVPPHQAVWIPAGTANSAEATGRVTMRAVYLAAPLVKRLPRRCRLVAVSPLLRELLERVMRHKTLDRRRAAERHLLDVLLDELLVLPHAAMDLPMPVDARAALAAALVRGAPAGAHRLTDVARRVGASARTLERLFVNETGLGFGAWRQRARLVRSLQLLAGGDRVTHAAIAVGYESTSAFVAAFRRALGTTPGRYFAAAGRR